MKTISSMRPFKTTLKFLLLLLVLPSTAMGHPQLQKAEQALKNGDKNTAFSAFEEVLNEGFQSAALHYNLGTLAFQKEQLGRAVFHLEKAAWLSPFDENTQTNLEIVRSACADTALGAQLEVSWWDMLIRAFPWGNGVMLWSIILTLGWCLLIGRTGMRGGQLRPSKSIISIIRSGFCLPAIQNLFSLRKLRVVRKPLAAPSRKLSGRTTT